MTFIFLCGIFSTRAENGGTGLADSLYHQRQFREAAIEYERAWFTAENAVLRAEARLGRVRCHKQLGSFKEAVLDLSEIPLYTLPDTLQQKIRYETALCCFLDSDFESAKSQLDQVRHYSGNKPLADEVILLEILNDNERFDYAKARETALDWIRQMKINSAVRDSLERNIALYYESGKLPRIARERKAIWLSQFLPGSGQAYAGFAAEGLFNFLLNFTALGTGVYAFVEGYYFTGYIVGAGLLQKLYLGGLRRASSLVVKGNYQRTRDFNDNARRFFLDVYALAGSK